MATSGGTSRGEYNLTAAAQRRLNANKGRDNSSFSQSEALSTLADAKTVKDAAARRAMARDRRDPRLAGAGRIRQTSDDTSAKIRMPFKR